MNEDLKQDHEPLLVDSISYDSFDRVGNDGSDAGSKPALICLSHLRWNFVYQRPQHLMTRFSRDRKVLFVEEPVSDQALFLEMRLTPEGVAVLVPHLPDELDADGRINAQRGLLNRYLSTEGIDDFVLWYYTPMSLAFTDHLTAEAVIYDCMDELSAFRGAPPEMLERERRLLDCADLVFTGGRSLYEAKRARHKAVYEFASAVDIQHFAAARELLPSPVDQASVPGPRLGFFGVLDERFDIGLLDAVAGQRPDWQFVMLGPVVKIDPNDLPRHANIHYLGLKSYAELPAYIAGWDVALMPFARNDSTRFISPTKTPEYLAAGKPVVATSIADVIAAYGHCAAVRIADTPREFITAIEASLRHAQRREALLASADCALAGQSWDNTWQSMDTLVAGVTA